MRPEELGSAAIRRDTREEPHSLNPIADRRYLVCQPATKLFQPAFHTLDCHRCYNAVFPQRNTPPISTGPHHVKP